MKSSQIFLYMSLWALHGGAPGLGLFAFDADTGEIEFLRLLDDRHSFGCSLIDPEKRMLYLCNEDDLAAETGYHTGRVYGFQIDPQTGAVEERFRRDTFCPFPDYLNFSADGRFLIVPHHSDAASVTTIQRDGNRNYVPVTRYMDSAIDLFSMTEDGVIDGLADVKKHSFPQRTVDYEGAVTIPHPHCAVRSPSGKLFAVCDKGDGHIYLYKIDEDAGQLTLLSKTMTDVPLSEPRYCAFHPTLPYLFVNHEHTGHGRMIVSAFRYDENGQLWPIGKVDCLPPSAKAYCGQGFCISPDGKFLYNQLSGYNAIVVLGIDQTTGQLSVLQRVPIEGPQPRCCALSPDGRFLVCGCLSGEIAVYAVGGDGLLTPTMNRAFLKGSAYLTFFDPHKCG